MKIKTTKLRNPLVAPSLHRKAGAHRRSNGGVRRCTRVALQRELRAELSLGKD